MEEKGSFLHVVSGVDFIRTARAPFGYIVGVFRLPSFYSKKIPAAIFQLVHAVHPSRSFFPLSVWRSCNIWRTCAHLFFSRVSLPYTTRRLIRFGWYSPTQKYKFDVLFIWNSISEWSGWRSSNRGPKNTCTPIWRPANASGIRRLAFPCKSNSNEVKQQQRESFNHWKSSCAKK